MSGQLLLTPADESVKRLKAVEGAHGQVSIENCEGGFNSEFDRYYVHLSGYCGHINPHTFAAAPDLLAALEALAANIGAASLVRNPLGKKLRAQAAAAIAKAKGAA